MRTLSADRARRLALGAQGFTDPPPTGRVDVRHFRRVLRRVGLIQLDSVNVFSRSHYMPFFSRLGPYDRDALDGWLWDSGEVFEYWAHEASLLPMDMYPVAPHSVRASTREFPARLRARRPGFVDEVLEEVRRNGPLQTSDLPEPGKRGEGMWNWSDGKRALEALFIERHVATAARPNFVRLYDLAERVIPDDVRMCQMDEEEALTEMLRRSARHHGIGSADDLADYYRVNVTRVRPILDRLVDDGELEKVDVAGWDRPAYLDPTLSIPQRVNRAALLSPFDSLVWYRPRLERLWNFHYRIEIYTPAPRRVYGYYVLPFLLDEELVGRVDLKTDRRTERLLVQGAFAEEGADRNRVARALTETLETTAGWLGMNGVEVKPNGDLAPLLSARL